MVVGQVVKTYAAEAFCAVSDSGPRSSADFTGVCRLSRDILTVGRDGREEGILHRLRQKKQKARVEGSMIRHRARIHTGGIEGVKLGKWRMMDKDEI